MKKERVLTDLQKAFLDHLFTDAKGDIKTAIKLAGYAETTKPREVVDSLRDEIINISKDILAANSSKAAFSLVGVLMDPSQAGANNILKAANEILTRVGVDQKKEDVKLNVPQGGLFILPAKGSSYDKIEVKDEKEEIKEDQPHHNED